MLAADQDCSVEIFFSWRNCQKLGWKASRYSGGGLTVITSEISGSTGRNYFVGVAVSRRDNISFQVLRFYPEGGAVFSDFISHIVPVGVTAYPGPSSELKRIS